MSHIKYSLCCMVSLLIAYGISAQEQQAYSFTDLGRTGDSGSEATALNRNGVTVGSFGYYSAGTIRERAFYYSGGLRNFDFDAGGAPNMTSSALAVDDAGCAVGWTQNTDGAPVYFEMFHAADSCPHNDTIFGANLGGLNSTAYGINNAGLMVGVSLTDAGSYHACSLAVDATTMTDLGVLSGGSSSAAMDINEDDLIVGYSDTASVVQTAVYWNGGVPTDLGAFPGAPAGTQSYALAVNDADSPQIVGWSYGSAAGGLQHAFLWQDGTMDDLGTLPGGDRSEAWDLNDLGEVVGWARTADYHVHAVLWDASGAIIDLNDVEGIPPGWVLAEAEGINNSGQIVGRGVFDGSDRAFLMTPVLFHDGFEDGGLNGWTSSSN